MLRLLSDENFDRRLLHRLQSYYSGLDLVRVQDVGLLHAADAIILEWAANEGRVLLTHDFRTMPDYAYERINKSLAMPGMILIAQDVTLADEVFMDLCLCVKSEASEWENRVQYLPL